MDTEMMFFLMAFAVYHAWCTRSANIRRREMKAEHDRLVDEYRQLHARDCRLIEKYRDRTIELVNVLMEAQKLHQN